MFKNRVQKFQKRHQHRQSQTKTKTKRKYKNKKTNTKTKKHDDMLSSCATKKLANGRAVYIFGHTLVLGQNIQIVIWVISNKT